MLNTLKRSWEAFRNGTPGERFQERYRRRHEQGKRGLSRYLYIGGGLALMAAGLFFLPAPGPGTVILIVGAGLIAQEWAPAARALDWLELRVRGLAAWLRGTWERSPLPARVLIALTALALACAAAYGIYRLFARG